MTSCSGPLSSLGVGFAAQGGRPAQDAEAERGRGAGERLGRRPAHPRGDPVAQGTGRDARGGEQEALVGRRLGGPDALGDGLDGDRRLAGPGGPEHPQHAAAVTDDGPLHGVERRGGGVGGSGAHEGEHAGDSITRRRHRVPPTGRGRGRRGVR